MAFRRSEIGPGRLALVLIAVAVMSLGGTWFGPLPEAHAYGFCGDIRTVTPQAMDLAAPLRTATNQADVDRFNNHAPNLIAQLNPWLHQIWLWPGWPTEQQHTQTFIDAVQDLQDTADAHGATRAKVQAMDDAATTLQQDCTNEGQ
jgi:hypothetical protein